MSSPRIIHAAPAAARRPTGSRTIHVVASRKCGLISAPPSTMPVDGDRRPAAPTTSGSREATSAAVSFSRSRTPARAPCSAMASRPASPPGGATMILPRRRCLRGNEPYSVGACAVTNRIPTSGQEHGRFTQCSFLAASGLHHPANSSSRSTAAVDLRPRRAFGRPRNILVARPAAVPRSAPRRPYKVRFGCRPGRRATPRSSQYS